MHNVLLATTVRHKSSHNGCHQIRQRTTATVAEVVELEFLVLSF